MVQLFYPAQTSFISIQIALARFLENQGWQAVFNNYPYWYLGSTPFKYLTGPVLPGLLVVLDKLLPGLNLFTIFFLTLLIVFPLGALGIYFLIRELKGEKRTALLGAIFYLFSPIIPFLFPFSDGLQLIAFSFLPYLLILYLRFLRKHNLKQAVYLIISMSFVILIDSLILTPLILGMLAVLLAATGWKKIEEKIKQTFLLLFLSLLIATIWYSPGYWWQVLLAPSFAGKPLFKVIGQLSQLLPASLAIGLAVFSARIIKSKNQVLKFCFYWLFIFGFLTLIRFISDPDFWLDWSSYGLELQFGLGIMISLLTSRIKGRLAGYKRGIIVSLLLISWLFLVNKKVISSLQKDITNSIEYKIGQILSGIVKPGERVFLSGSSVFWLNAFFDIPQVRGGNDRASVNKQWRQAAWEIREGEKVDKSIRWLKELDISYLVIHTQDSDEFFHDFKYPEKFEGVRELEKIYEQNGDRIYKVLD